MADGIQDREQSEFKVKGVRLKVCPFCCEPPMRMDVGEGNKALMIECVTEGCVNPHISYYDREFAVKLWNWRKPFPKRQPGEKGDKRAL